LITECSVRMSVWCWPIFCFKRYLRITRRTESHKVFSCDLTWQLCGEVTTWLSQLSHAVLELSHSTLQKGGILVSVGSLKVQVLCYDYFINLTAFVRYFSLYSVDSSRLLLNILYINKSNIQLLLRFHDILIKYQIRQITMMLLENTKIKATATVCL